MKLYLIEDDKERVFFQATRKKDALKKLKKMKKFKKYKNKNLSIKTDNNPYVVFIEDDSYLYYCDYNKMASAREKAKELCENRKIDTTVGIKDYMKLHGSYKLDGFYNYNVIPIGGFCSIDLLSIY